MHGHSHTYICMSTPTDGDLPTHTHTHTEIRGEIPGGIKTLEMGDAKSQGDFLAFS